MPSGKIHALTTTVAAGALGPLIFMVGKQPLIHASAFSAGCLLGLFINPDLDIDHGNKSYALVRESTGRMGVSLWQIFWWPYARLIPHRSPLSHMPIIGTAIRMGYLVVGPVLVWAALRMVLPLPPLTLPSLTPLWWWGFAGLALVDTLHAAQDRISRLLIFC
jgi:uncharacterized metal-binding protein